MCRTSSFVNDMTLVYMFLCIFILFNIIVCTAGSEILYSINLCDLDLIFIFVSDNILNHVRNLISFGINFTLPDRSFGAFSKLLGPRGGGG